MVRAGVTICTSGGVASRFTVTDELDVPPSLVALQVNVVPAVSAVTLAVTQPEAEKTGVCSSHGHQFTVASDVYQPSPPRLPLIHDQISGGVPSRNLNA